MFRVMDHAPRVDEIERGVIEREHFGIDPLQIRGEPITQVLPRGFNRLIGQIDAVGLASGAPPIADDRSRLRRRLPASFCRDAAETVQPRECTVQLRNDAVQPCGTRPAFVSGVRQRFLRKFRPGPRFPIVTTTFIDIGASPFAGKAFRGTTSDSTAVEAESRRALPTIGAAGSRAMLRRQVRRGGSDHRHCCLQGDQVLPGCPRADDRTRGVRVVCRDLL